MEKKILFTATPTEKRAALVENNRVIELVVERPDTLRLVGNIYRGRIVSILPGLQAAFVDIGLEQAAFLHASDVDPSLLTEKGDEAAEQFARGRASRRRVARVPVEKLLTVGQQILVQVEKEPIGTKGARVTTQISLAGRFLVLVPDADFIGISKELSDDKKRRQIRQIVAGIKPPGIGFIVRTNGLKVAEPEFVKELHALLDRWKQTRSAALEGSGPCLVCRELGITTSVIRDIFDEDVAEVWVDERADFEEIKRYLAALSPELLQRVILHEGTIPLFDKFNIEKDLERSLRRRVWLKSGGYVLFDHTEALLAIDVNTGRNTGKGSIAQTIFQTNMEAADEICRQLRLRDIGGQIVVDFIDMENPRDRHSLEEHMRDLLLNKDPSAASLTGLSKFGLMEITRKRVRPELRELYTDVCETCNGLGWVFSPATVSTRIDRTLARASTQLQGDKALVLAVHPSVHAYLSKDHRVMITRLEKEYGVHITLKEDLELDQDEYKFFRTGEHEPLEFKWEAAAEDTPPHRHAGGGRHR